MRSLAATIFVVAGLHLSLVGQPLDRVRFNEQDLFLSGSNVSWVNYARDIGPGFTDLSAFRSMFSQLSDAGGNSMRFWLHINGTNTPQWDGSTVIGPGPETIDDLRNILDIAWENDVGLVLCLWSFDMLRISVGSLFTSRSEDLLTDPSLTQAYIDNALTPMVESLADHPAIIAWEIFNEPEGMSVEHGWNFNLHVPMADIQRFTNMTAGAIHRADSTALVTNGSWSFIASSDQTLGKSSPQASELSSAEIESIRASLSNKYVHLFTQTEAQEFYDALHSAANFNYYTDERLIAAGGDPDGTLDFYGVHYYEWAGTSLSPFHNDFDAWGLDKPVVIGEFYLGGSSSSGGDGDPDYTYGIYWRDLYENLLSNGYAGGLAWQWYNYPSGAEGRISWPRILESTASLFDRYPEAVSIDRGLEIVQFDVSPSVIELGHESGLRWFVNSATSVELNGDPVEASGSRTISPTETTVYRLKALDGTSGDTLVQEVVLTVLKPNDVNRALDQLAVASSEETCCAGDETADLATDGDLATQWTSAWSSGLADDDPNMEWIYLDLGSAYDLERVLLHWTEAYGFSYNVDASYDGRTWRTEYEERNGIGGVDTVWFDPPVSTQFVRMWGLGRGTRNGFSLAEFEAFGTLSALQPPRVDLTIPINGALLEPGEEVSITASASDPDGQIAEVTFFVDDQILESLDESPYTISWVASETGTFDLSASTVDDDGITTLSNSTPVFVTDVSTFSRFEAESASYEGDAETRVSLGASGRRYAALQTAGIAEFGDIEVFESGVFLVKFRYRLPVDDDIACLVLEVNDEPDQDLCFNGARGIWYQRGLNTNLEQGANKLALSVKSGMIDMDFISVSVAAVNVAASDDSRPEIPQSVELSQNYPNPFEDRTRIQYSIPKATDVKVELLDLTGRHVTTLVDETRAAGIHVVTLEVDDMASGVYLYRLTTKGFVETKRLVILK